MFAFKIGQKLTSNESRKIGLVTVVWARDGPKKKKKKNGDQASELPVVIKFSSLSAPTKIEELTAGSVAEREENLIGMIPTRASLRLYR